MGVDVVAVVVTFNSADVVEALLDSIPGAVGGLAYAIVVVDNGSTDSTRSVLATRSDHHLIMSHNSGFAAGVNKGVRDGPLGNAVLVLNSDVRLESGSVERLMTRLHHPGVGVVAPQVFDETGKLQHSLRREPTLGRALGFGRTRWSAFSEYHNRVEDYRAPRKVDWALGAALLISRECWDSVGPWDETFFLYSEETDFSLRAVKIGFETWYEPSARIVHIGGASGRSATTHTMQILNRVRLYRRRHSLVASGIYYALTVLSEFTWVMRGAGEQSRASVAALLFPRRRPKVLGCSDSLIPR